MKSVLWEERREEEEEEESAPGQRAVGLVLGGEVPHLYLVRRGGEGGVVCTGGVEGNAHPRVPLSQPFVSRR